jgi:2'-5' RNA ligase
MKFMNENITLCVRSLKDISNTSLHEKKDPKKKPTGWIGIRVSKEICDQLQKIDVPGIKEQPDDFHITMIYFGEQTSEDFVHTTAVLSKFVDLLEPIVIKTEKVVSFGEGDDGFPIVCEIESPQLLKIHKKLCDTLDKEGIEYSKKWPVFKPHVCLSYSKESLSDFKIVPLEWEANSIEMWLGHNGSKIKTELSLIEECRARLLHQVAQAALFDDLVSPNFIGTKCQIAIFEDVIKTTRTFIEKMNDNMTPMNVMLEALKNKHEAAIRFKQEFNVDWKF